MEGREGICSCASDLKALEGGGGWYVVWMSHGRLQRLSYIGVSFTSKRGGLVEHFLSFFHVYDDAEIRDGRFQGKAGGELFPSL